ncbi:hypothetical protein PO620_23845, partial [Enterobacter cloacae]
LGVDISKRSSVVAHYKNGKFQKEFFIQNNKNGYNYLLKYLNDLDHPQLIFDLQVSIQEVWNDFVV